MNQSLEVILEQIHTNLHRQHNAVGMHRIAVEERCNAIGVGALAIAAMAFAGWSINHIVAWVIAFAVNVWVCWMLWQMERRFQMKCRAFDERIATLRAEHADLVRQRDQA